MPCSIKLLILGFISICSMAFAKENNFHPTLQLRCTPIALGNFGTYSMLGEVGNKNYRGGATYGLYFTPWQRFKISGEYLAQKNNYHFLVHKTSKWNSQYDVGAEHQLLLRGTFLQSINLGAAYSHAYNRKLSDLTFGNSTTLSRRIAGSNGGYGFIGSTVKLWGGALLTGALNYDYVKYNQRWHHLHLVKGLGGSVNLIQHFAHDFQLAFTAEIRKPFNFYEGKIGWSQHLTSCGIINWAIFGNYTSGKNRLPNITTAGILLGFTWDADSQNCSFCISPSIQDDLYPYYDQDGWISKPAAYMPRVLAVID